VSRSYRAALIGLTLVVALVGAYTLWNDLRSPESTAQEDSYAVWIALLKGFNGDVVYVGSDERYAYFRLGTVFWSYYKVPACSAQLPEVYSVGGGSPYAVKLHVEAGYIRPVSKCAHVDGYTLGVLDRK
jgi:hypothetical protein